MEKALLDRRRRRRWNDGLGATIGVTREVVWQSAVLKLMLCCVHGCSREVCCACGVFYIIEIIVLPGKKLQKWKVSFVS